MIETIRLFDEDSHQTLFEGCVLSCEQDGDLYKITLNQTMFFPEEGGQSCDRGKLNDIPVEKVLEKETRVQSSRLHSSLETAPMHRLQTMTSSALSRESDRMFPITGPVK